MDVFSASSASLFPDPTAQSAQLDRLSNTALANGLELYSSGKYDQAIRELKRSVGLAPVSTQAVSAYKYIARSYAQLGDNQSAIATYKQSLRLSANNPDTYVALGNVHFSDGNYTEAQKAYEQAVSLDPSAPNHYSLGQAYMENGLYDAAERQFETVRKLAPSSPSGVYGIGQVYAKEGKTAQAVSAFDAALELQSNFWNALADKGYALADAGATADAQAAAQTLLDNGSSLAAPLSTYIYENAMPQMTGTGFGSTFPVTLGPGTPLVALGVQGAGETKTFSMVFEFSKDMDPASVQNVLNWSITRSTGSGTSAYNFNLPIPSTEVTLPRIPKAVAYDPAGGTATVFFQLTQNDAGNGTIDPSHVQFSYAGKDAYGVSMDTKADQYTGFSGIA